MMLLCFYPDTLCSLERLCMTFLVNVCWVTSIFSFLNIIMSFTDDLKIIWESIHVFIPTLQCQQTRRYTQHLDFSHNSESDRAALFNHTHILKVWSSKKTETIYEHHKGVWEISPCCGLYVSCVQCLLYAEFKTLPQMIRLCVISWFLQ